MPPRATRGVLAYLARLSRLPSRAEPLLPDAVGEAGLAVQMATLAFLSMLSVCSTSFSLLARVPPGVADEVPIQIVPAPGRDGDADLARAVSIARGTAGVVAARALSKNEAEGLLKPWVGPNLDLSSIPVPRLVLLTPAQDARPDLAGLTGRLRQEIPGAQIEDAVAGVPEQSAMPTPDRGGIGVWAVALLFGAAAAFGTVWRAVKARRRDFELLGLLGGDPAFIGRRCLCRHLVITVVASMTGAVAAPGALMVTVMAAPPWALVCVETICVAGVLGAAAGLASLLSVRAVLRR